MSRLKEIYRLGGGSSTSESRWDSDMSESLWKTPPLEECFHVINECY